MKKLWLLALPLITLVVFPSCNDDSRYTVNAEEMLDAFDLSDEEYLQTTTQYNRYKEPTVFNEFSPTVYHHLSTIDGYFERYVVKNKATCIQYIRESPDSDFDSEEIDPSDFPTPFSATSELLKPIIDYKYEDFTYNKSTHEYLVSFTEEGDKYHSAITFIDKRVDHFANWHDDAGREDPDSGTVYFHYEKYTPEYPPTK